ncbi:hypothetical protein [Alkalicoccus luteus]|uniref:Uncharacterized protein n=1 Tax=Alkalicoccus luteus TaxID=1237094 RepID=A0A969PQ97_9BACI|nr:hypothetical protein [Alkalicoccus luteus]NJP37423.1 hypothetical protein [Alkalicoccus luteus]
MEKLLSTIFDAVKKRTTIDAVDTELENAYRTDEGELIVYLSVGNSYTRAFVTMGRGKTAAEAINEAIESYLEYRVRHLKPISVKLDVIREVVPGRKQGSRLNVKKDEILYRRGEDGFAFSEDLRISFLPEEVEAYKMIQERHLVKENAFLAFEKHPLLFDQKAVKTLLTNEFMDVYKVRTHAHYYDKNGYLKLYRGHRFFDDLNRDDLVNAITLAKNNYFKQAVNSKGKIVYAYQPHNGSQASGYNILRHAGTTYSMLEVHEMMPDDRLLDAAKRGINFLKKKVEDIEINGIKAQAVVEKGAAKLGGNGLAIVCLAKYTELTGDRKHLELMQNLATWMGELQDESGKFAVHKQKVATGENTGFISHYYPGEAILAMVRLYKIDGDEKWLDFAENEANYLITDRDKTETIDTIAHDHWLLYGLNELYRERPKDMYLKHSFFIADAMIHAQRLDTNEYSREWIGSYKQPGTPRSTPTACRSEGLGAAYRLAMDHGYEDKAASYKAGIHEGIKFQLQMQLRPESVMYYMNKRLCLGAFHAGLKNYELRNDYTQHNISSLISYAGILEK